MISTTSSETTVFSAVLALFADAHPTIRLTETNKHFLNMFHLARLKFWSPSAAALESCVQAGDGIGHDLPHGQERPNLLYLAIIGGLPPLRTRTLRSFSLRKGGCLFGT